MSRKKKLPGDLRRKRFGIMLSDLEFAVIKRAATLANLDVSTWMRAKILAIAGKVKPE